MLRNYLRVALRSLFRNKLYSFINIFGLAIGMTACLMIFLWVRNEVSYDRFHEKADRIYRIERKIDFREIHGQAPITSGPYGPALVSDYPEIENYVRLEENELVIKDHRNINRKQEVLFADNSVFDVFDFRLERGNAKTALVQPRSIVITRENALKYLGTEDAVGKSLTIDWNEQPVEFQITGILEKVPQTSFVQFDMLASLSTYSDERLTPWFNNFLHTFLLVKKGVSPQMLEAKFASFLTKYMAADFIQILGPDADINDVFQLKMKPLLSIHLHPGEQFEIEPQGSLTSVIIFSAIAILILIIACVNFMNLSTARANKRAREVGMRKTIGAQKSQLWIQFLGESVLLAFISLLMTLGMIRLCLPLFSFISGKSLFFNQLFLSGNWLMLIGITLTTGLLAGLYPAFYLTSFEPAQVLKGGAFKGTGKAAFRTVLTVGQFVISITLIIGTLVIARQMDYIQKRPLGFEKENMIVIPVEDSQVRGNIAPFRNALSVDPRIKSVAGSSNLPGSRTFSDTVFKRDDSDDVFDLAYMFIDYDFIDTMKLEVSYGRGFSREFGADQEDTFIINEAAARELGYSPEEAVGKRLLRLREANKLEEGTIVGVVKDFHFKSLHQIIEPFLLMLEPEYTRYISVWIVPGDVGETIDFIRNTWMGIYPGNQFEYSFLDERILRLYQSEGRMQSIFLVFSVLSIFVACLGLFGLAAFTAQERTKEIGIRKALGASSGNIFILLSREFAKWVLLANVIAWPLAYFAMNQWMQNFAYKIKMGLAPFLLSAVLAVGIALLTVSYQSTKAALTDPSVSLRYE